MNKTKLIMIMIIILLIGAALIYYFYQMFSITKPVLDSAVDIKQKMEEISKSQQTVLSQELEEEKDMKDVYTYRESFRDPFDDYEKEEEIFVEKKVNKITSADIRNMLPFSLNGTIGNDKKRLAIIQTNDGTKIIKKGDSIKDFKIKNIMENSILISYKGIILELKLRSGAGDLQ